MARFRHDEAGQAEFLAMAIVLVFFVYVFAGILNFGWYVYALSATQSTTNRLAQQVATTGQFSPSTLSSAASAQLSNDGLHGQANATGSIGGASCAQLQGGGDYQGQLGTVTVHYHFSPLLFSGGYQFLFPTISSTAAATVTTEYASC